MAERAGGARLGWGGRGWGGLPGDHDAAPTPPGPPRVAAARPRPARGRALDRQWPALRYVRSGKGACAGCFGHFLGSLGCSNIFLTKGGSTQRSIEKEAQATKEFFTRANSSPSINVTHRIVTIPVAKKRGRRGCKHEEGTRCLPTPLAPPHPPTAPSSYFPRQTAMSILTAGYGSYPCTSKSSHVQSVRPATPRGSCRRRVSVGNGRGTRPSCTASAPP